MPTAIAEVKTLLDRLPENSHLEDSQYHLYVMEKIQRVNDENFDYTKWQKQLWQDEALVALSEQAQKAWEYSH